MLKLVLFFYDETQRALNAGVYLKELLDLEVRDKIARAKYVSEESIENIDAIFNELSEVIDELISKGGIMNA